MKHFLLSLALLACAACGPELPGDASSENPSLDNLESHEAPLVTPPAGSIPAGLPARLLVGLFEDTGQTWMKDSGVPWDVRYRYFTKGWVNNWGWAPADGSWGQQFMRECDAQGFIPAVQYYQLNRRAGRRRGPVPREGAERDHDASYFGDFKVLMQRAKEFGKPVLVLLEADGFGFLQQQTQSNPNAYAAIAATGLPELAGLPNTVAGWGLAFLQMRKAVGANNAILGIHISAWASGKDIAHFSVTDPLQPEVDKVYNFLARSAWGPTSRARPTTCWWAIRSTATRTSTGSCRGRTAGGTRATRAAISSKSFNRYAEWLRLWNVTSGKRWVLWQIPLGNSNHQQRVQQRQRAARGLQGQPPRVLLRQAAPRTWRSSPSSGVIALLFGRGEGGQSSYTNDVYTDGQLFMKSRAGAFLKAGGLAIPATGSTVRRRRLPRRLLPRRRLPRRLPPRRPAPTPRRTASRRERRGGPARGTLVKGVTSSTARAFAGSRSLAVTMGGTAAGMSRVSVPNAAVPAGRTVSVRVWIPAGSRITGIQPYVQQGAAGGWAVDGQVGGPHVPEGR